MWECDAAGCRMLTRMLGSLPATQRWVWRLSDIKRVASGGQVTEIDLDAFLSGPRNHEQDALLRLIGTLILDPHGAVMTDSPTWIPAGSGGMRSCASLADMLPRGLSIEEVARLLLRGLPRSARRGGRPSLPVAGGPIRQALGRN